jgi:hypothetical protein
METVTTHSINCISKRIKYIDLFQEIRILIMILDHIYIGNIFSYFIHFICQCFSLYQVTFLMIQK